MKNRQNIVLLILTVFVITITSCKSHSDCGAYNSVEVENHE